MTGFFIFLSLIYIVHSIPGILYFIESRNGIKKLKEDNKRLEKKIEYKVSIFKHPDEVKECLNVIKETMGKDNANLN